MAAVLQETPAVHQAPDSCTPDPEAEASRTHQAPAVLQVEDTLSRVRAGAYLPDPAAVLQAHQASASRPSALAVGARAWAFHRVGADLADLARALAEVEGADDDLVPALAQVHRLVLGFVYVAEEVRLRAELAPGRAARRVLDARPVLDLDLAYQPVMGLRRHFSPQL